MLKTGYMHSGAGQRIHAVHPLLHPPYLPALPLLTLTLPLLLAGLLVPHQRQTSGTSRQARMLQRGTGRPFLSAPYVREISSAGSTIATF
jgi:hypothetical protein